MSVQKDTQYAIDKMQQRLVNARPEDVLAITGGQKRSINAEEAHRMAVDLARKTHQK